MSEPATQKGPVAIIGAGIVGVSTAIWLQRAGYDVVLIDRAGPAGGASYGNAGVLAACSVVPLTVPGLIAKAPRMLLDPREPLYVKWSYLPKLLPFLFRYLSHCTPEKVAHIARAMLPIVGDSVADHRALAAGTGAERWIEDAPYRYIYRDRAHFESDAFVWNVRRAHGVVWDELEGEALRIAEPALNPIHGFAASARGQGRISDPGEYVKALAAHVFANGGRFVKAEVEDIVREGGRVTGVRAGGETIPCTAAVIATGAWSVSLARKLGLSIPLESERGYHIELVEPSLKPNASLMVASGKFAATPMEGRLRLAGIVEFGGLEAPPSRAPFELLRRHAETLLPGMTWKETREWMGHRPAPSDSIPVIGEVAGVPGAYMGFGHHHVGLTGGPKTGAILAGLISGRRPNLDLSPYAPERFR